jgi:hypothetical protein
MTASLTIFTVYENPTDYPGLIVVRGFLIGSEGAEPLAECELFGSLEEARSVLGGRRLFQLARHPEDDPTIVETWF